ncbi:hypothetical protein [Streptomyces pacificus]|uniref:hypothetical protein n=1 Tax=Streptomyces pacificus TaxID=2705029 RepID=UPI0020B16FBE|nr:hypothetical protein [Streptomyces pacificus]
MATTATTESSTSNASAVLSLRMDGELLDRLREHAARRGTSVQDYVVRTLVRNDFDERFKAAVDETDEFYGQASDRPGPSGDPARPGRGAAPGRAAAASTGTRGRPR